MMYQRILLAVDGSQASDLAVQQAATMAKACGATVQALYVLDSTDVYYNLGVYDPGGVTEALRAFGERVLREAGERLGAAGVDHSTKLRKTPVAPGQVAATIVAEAEEWNADLIVLGTHGRRGVRRVVLGSVAEGVVRRWGRAVLLVRCPVEE